MKVSPAKVALGLLGVGLLACFVTNQGPSSLAMHFRKPVALTAAAPQCAWEESRSSSWDGAAAGIVANLKNAGVARGQIISIDAHNNGPTGKAIFSAHYCTDLPSQGALDLTFTEQNTLDGWATHYSNANDDAGSDVTDLVSITSSVNSGGYAVTYVFKYSPQATNAVSHSLSTLEARAGSWNGAADDIISQIKQSGAQRGQIVGIDAHNNGEAENAIFSATIDLEAPGFGPINDITYEVQNTNDGWAAIYDQAAAQVTPDTISITASCNSGGYSVMYVFRYL